jgi:hypothetical protein
MTKRTEEKEYFHIPTLPFRGINHGQGNIFHESVIRCCRHKKCKKGDFLVNDNVVFEIGGRNKKPDQTKDIENTDHSRKSSKFSEVMARVVSGL